MESPDLTLKRQLKGIRRCRNLKFIAWQTPPRRANEHLMFTRNSYHFDWLIDGGLTHNFSHISAVSSPTHVLHQYVTQLSMQPAAFPHSLLYNLWKKNVLFTIGKRHKLYLAELGFELTTPWSDSPRRYPTKLPGLGSFYLQWYKNDPDA